jgi:hypothetical protein
VVNNVNKKQTASVFRNNGRSIRLLLTWKIISILPYKTGWDSKLVILKQFHKNSHQNLNLAASNQNADRVRNGIDVGVLQENLTFNVHGSVHLKNILTYI